MDYEDFVESTDISNHNLQFYLDGMNEENGEISGIWKRVRRGDYGKEAKNAIDHKTGGMLWCCKNINGIETDLLKEIGDRHWYETRFLQELGRDWQLVESMNMEKLKKRRDTGTIIGKGDTREEHKA
jgi:hypothetical protein